MSSRKRSAASKPAQASVAATKRVLHVGCGPYLEHKLHAAFKGAEWQEVRFDIDPKVKPDIVGDIIDMQGVESGAYDALYSSHNIEHLFAHQVPLALKEFFRILKPGGMALITCPDLEPVAKLIAEGKLEEPAYQAPSAPVTPLDILYGWSGPIARGNHFMAHRTGFTSKTLGNKLLAAGFGPVRLWRGHVFDLWAEATKPGAPQ